MTRFYLVTYSHMFTGKVYINRNGQVVEKEFDNHQDYRSFLKEQNIRFPSVDMDDFPKFSLGGWSQFHNYLNNLIDEKLSLPSFWTDEESSVTTPKLTSRSGAIDFSSYEKELEQLELSQAEVKSQIQSLKSDQDTLESMRNKFISHGKDENDEMMKRLDADIKKVKDEIKSLEKRSSRK